MKWRVAVVLLVMAACLAVVCESDAVSKQRHAAAAAASDAGGLSGWLAGLTTNRRHFIPPLKHRAAAQKRTHTKELEDRDYLEAIGIGGSSWGSSSSNSHWDDDDWP